MSDARFSHSQYRIDQQFLKLLGGNFRVYDPNNSLVLFSHQKAFKLKEDIRIYADESKTLELVGVFARQVIDFSAAYDVVDLATNVKVGALKRKGWSSIVRDKWIVMDANDVEIGEINEDSMALALLRRLLTNLVPQSYSLTIGGQEYVQYHQRFNPFLKKVDVKFTPAAQQLDRRFGLAIGVLLMAIEGRQSG